jgi:uncharacterized phage-associated protein
MFAFKFDKAVQAVAYLLRRELSREMNYMRLLKILYIADRESIRETGRPITGDRVAAMKQGPVLSELLDLIKGIHLRFGDWERFIQRDAYNVRLVGEPGLANLSRFEIETLERVAEKHRSQDEWEMVEFTHTFPEWKKNDPGDSMGMKWISFGDVLEALGRSADLPEIEEDAKADRAFARLFGA